MGSRDWNLFVWFAGISIAIRALAKPYGVIAGRQVVVVRKHRRQIQAVAVRAGVSRNFDREISSTQPYQAHSLRSQGIGDALFLDPCESAAPDRVLVRGEDVKSLGFEVSQIITGHYVRLGIPTVVDPNVQSDRLADLEFLLSERNAQCEAVSPRSHDGPTLRQQFRFVAFLRNSGGLLSDNWDFCLPANRKRRGEQHEVKERDSRRHHVSSFFEGSAGGL